MEQIAEFLEIFWYKTTTNVSHWRIIGCIAAVVLIYQLLKLFTPKLVSPVHRFLTKHPLIWILIPAALLIYFVYVSLGWNLIISLSGWNDMEATDRWNGLYNFTRLFTDPLTDFWPSLWNTLLMFGLIPLCLLLGLGLAIVMDQNLRGTSVFRTLILLPFALSFVVTGVVWKYMYQPTGGIINSFLGLFGVNTSAAMADGRLMWTSTNNYPLIVLVIIAMVWQFSGYVAVVFLAAIKNVPVSTINAAKLDGAYMPRIYWRLVIPQLKGAVGSCITILAMFALRSFDFIIALFNENNAKVSTLPILMYNTAFAKNDYALSAAIGSVLLALVLILILPLTYWTNKRK